MTEIVNVSLENDMDLILAHKRSMKIGELCGLSVLAQTAFATAISEISRCVIHDQTYKPLLRLGLNSLRNNRKELIATINVNDDFEKTNADAVKYARRLADSIKFIRNTTATEIQFIQNINFSGLINEVRMESFVDYFKRELPLSPYDELRKKNIQLLDLAERLRDSENQYKSLTETLPLMMFTANSAGHLTYANKWLKDFFKLTEINPSKHAWQNFVDIADNKSIREEWEKSFQSQSPLRTQARLLSKKNNEVLWHLITLIPVKNENNQLVSWTGFFVDIHAQKLIEETLKNNEELKFAQKQLLSYQSKLEEKVDELNKSNHDLEQFAYIASHDLQEPLRKIRNFADLLQENIDDKAKTHKYADKIDQASARMLVLIKDVLNYSRLSKTENNFVNTDLQEVLNNVKLDMELLINDKGAVIKSTSLPTINGISLQIYQLFYNMISNSLKFSNTTPEIAISSRELTASEVRERKLHSKGKHIELTFQDNGIGFEEKYAGQIFTIFKRLNPKGSYEGTGIGLALCKKIIDNHFGAISVKSEVGKGTAFHVTLPVE